MSLEVEVPAGIRNKIRSWNLSQEVEREFYARLIDEFQSTSVYKKLLVTESGMELDFTVEGTPRQFFRFALRLYRNDMCFQIYQCSCACIEDGVVVWSSDDA